MLCECAGASPGGGIGWLATPLFGVVSVSVKFIKKGNKTITKAIFFSDRSNIVLSGQPPSQKTPESATGVRPHPLSCDSET